MVFYTRIGEGKGEMLFCSKTKMIPQVYGMVFIHLVQVQGMGSKSPCADPQSQVKSHPRTCLIH